MLRALTLTLLSTTAASAQMPWSLALRGETPDAEPCGALPVGEVRLASAEFEIDIRLNPGVLHLRLPPTLPATAEHPTLRISGGVRTVPIALNQVNPLQAAHRAGALQAVLDLREAPGPRADRSCAESQVEQVKLYVSDVLYASAHQAEPVEAEAESAPRSEVTVGRLQREDGSAEFPEEVLHEKFLFHGEACLRRGHDGRTIRGSVVIELRSRRDGTLQRPTAPVDGLQRPELVFCLVNAIYDDAQIARSTPAGAHLFAPFYFRPASTLLTDRPTGH